MLYQKNKKIFIYLLLFLTIGTFNNKNLNSMNFPSINQISVIGLDDENNFQIKNKLDFLNGDNLFFLNPGKITKIMNTNNLVEKYSVSKIYPSKLNIEINKTKFLAQIKKDDDIFFLGSNGRLIKKNNMEYDLPFIFGKFEIESFLEFKKNIIDANFDYTKIKKLFFFKSGRWDIELKSGLLIKLPNENVKSSFKFLLKFLDENNNKKINIIDLRLTNQVIING